MATIKSPRLQLTLVEAIKKGLIDRVRLTCTIEASNGRFVDKLLSWDRDNQHWEVGYATGRGRHYRWVIVFTGKDERRAVAALVSGME